MHAEMDDDLEEEKIKQRKIVDTLLGSKSGRKRKKKSCSPPLLARYDPTLHEHSDVMFTNPAGDGGNGDCGQEIETPGPKSNPHVTENLSHLFSGQQFSFLPQRDEKEGEKTENVSSQKKYCRSHSSISDPDITTEGKLKDCEGSSNQPRTLFFFHWEDPQLANRQDISFHATKSREQLQQKWPFHRSAIKQLLRHSHKHALRYAAQRKRTAVAVDPTSNV